ncbi:hypothetical protein [Paragemmobacter straminiformis]|uniref:hypothetical protein n=1 Tax=Paragemmobacter straminiformis TaxID=2045119 RepID=UPI00240F989E|nr:hypothetical protein [Gemmobacter straminiformis]
MRRLLLPLLFASLTACTLSLPGKSANAPASPPAILGPGTVEVTPLDAPAPTAAAPTTAAPTPSAPATAAPASGAKPATAPKPRPDTATTAPPAQDRPAQAPAPASEPEPKPEPTPTPEPVSPEQAKCEAKGGTWSATGLAKLHSCIHPTRDSGKSCDRASDCEGLCLSRSRTCAPVKPLFGCNPILQDDGTEATLCID